MPWTERVAEKLNYTVVDKKLLSYYKRLIDSVIKNKKETNSKVQHLELPKLIFLCSVADFVLNCTHIMLFFFFKPGLHERQLPVESSVTLVSSIAVERRCGALQVSSVARLQEKKEKWRSTQLTVVIRVNQALAKLLIGY